MNEYEWRQSGKDANQHAFRAEGGYIPRQNLVSVVPLSAEYAPAEEFFGPYEACIAECGHIVPIAMLMPQKAGQACTGCRVLTGAPPPAEQRHQRRPLISTSAPMLRP